MTFIHGDVAVRRHVSFSRMGMTRVMEDEELMGKHGDMGTFVIRVSHRRHGSWQGRVTYLDENKTVYFRSALELIKIMDSALEKAERMDERPREKEGSSNGG